MARRSFLTATFARGESIPTSIRGAMESVAKPYSVSILGRELVTTSVSSKGAWAPRPRALLQLRDMRKLSPRLLDIFGHVVPVTVGWKVLSVQLQRIACKAMVHENKIDLVRLYWEEKAEFLQLGKGTKPMRMNQLFAFKNILLSQNHCNAHILIVHYSFHCSSTSIWRIRILLTLDSNYKN